MADDESSPRPFRRERNLSNRNFAKRGSNRRRFSTESHSSIDLKLSIATNSQDAAAQENATQNNDDTSTSTSNSTFNTTSSSMNISYSVNSDTDTAFNKKSLLKMRSIDIADIKTAEDDNRHSAAIYNNDDNQQQQRNHQQPQTPDPALLGVKQKLLLFENLKADERIIFKTSKFKSKSTQSLLNSERASPSSPTSSTTSGSYLLQVYPMGNELGHHATTFHTSIDERSEDEVDSIEDEVVAVADATESSAVDSFGRSVSRDSTVTIEEHNVTVSAVNKSFLTPVFKHSKSHHGAVLTTMTSTTSTTDNEPDEVEVDKEAVEAPKPKTKDFPRNYRSRPKTEIIGGSSAYRILEANKFNSLHHKPKYEEPEEEIELRDKGYSFIQPILDELIKTEETYVENLWIGINNYGDIFQRADLPTGLRGKKYVLLGNVEQLAEFHRDEFLPMLQRNRHDLKRIFDEFQNYIDNNCFYGYVLFTMNKQRSLKLCDIYKNYFKLLQTELDDKLGINSFLVQPIQRMARYPLLLQQFITTLFKNRDYVMKPIIESCCRLEKKLRNLLTTTNESEVINDIVCLNEHHEFNTFYQGKFRKVSEFHVFDHTLKRTYRSKVFIFDKCIIYTEIKGKQLIFHGRYPCEHIGISAKIKQFTLFYQHRKQQECDFIGDPALIEQWLDLIREMIRSYADEERRKMKELHSKEYGGDHMHRKPANLALFRDSNRFSTDSGIGNIWVVPKPDQEEGTNNRTTWYAVT